MNNLQYNTMKKLLNNIQLTWNLEKTVAGKMVSNT